MCSEAARLLRLSAACSSNLPVLHRQILQIKKQPVIVRFRLSDLSEKITYYFVNVILIEFAFVSPKNNAKASESVLELGLNVNVLFVPSSTLKLPE